MKHIDIAQKLKTQFLKQGADDVVITLEEEDSTQIKFSNNKVSATQTWDSMNLHIFAAVDKKIIVTSMHDFSETAINDAVSRLIKFAESAQPNKEYEGIAEGPFTYKHIAKTFDKAIAENKTDMTDKVEQGITTALNAGAKRVAGVFETNTISSYLLTSNNVEAEDQATRAYFSLRAFMERDASGHCVSNARFLADCDVVGSAAKAADIAKKAQSPKPGVQGKYDVIFEPLAASNIIEHVGSAASIFSVESGLSPLANKLGESIGSNTVNLVDDPTREGAVGALSFDAEGVSTQKNNIIEKGTLKTYLHNTSSAKRHGVATTANAGIITPTPFNLILQNGNVNKAELFEQIKRGLWITNVWYTRFQNYESGDFSTIPRDGIFLIENGKITQSIKDIRISENLLNLLANVKATGDDVEQVMGWEVETPVTTPSILIENVNVTKSVE